MLLIIRQTSAFGKTRLPMDVIKNPTKNQYEIAKMHPDHAIKIGQGTFDGVLEAIKNKEEYEKSTEEVNSGDSINNT